MPRRRDLSATEVTLSLFGGPVLKIGSDPVRLSPLQAALVGTVFGARDPEGISRRRLAWLLWAEDDDADVRHRLSQLVYALGQKVTPHSLMSGGGERIRPDVATVTADIGDFHEWLEGGSLGRCAELLGKGFLTGLPRIPTRPYEEWLDTARATLRARVRERAVARLRRATSDHDWPAAEVAADTLLSLAPGDEAVLRKVMWVRAMRRRIDEAVAAYRGFAERAAAQDPAWRCEEETAELLERIHDLRPKANPPPELRHLAPQPEPPLCGRDEELARISRVVAAEAEAGISAIVVEGEAGIGKTRLVEEGIRAARLLGFRVLRGQSSEFEQDIPFNPILGALDEDEVGVALNRLEDPWRSVLLPLMPQFHWEDGPLPDVPYVQPGSVPRRMFEAIRKLVQEVAAGGPLLLFFDDFQWADETSVAALEFLRRRWSSGRVVLVLALRPGSPGTRSRASHLARELSGHDDVSHVQLSDLSGSAAESLVEAVASRALTAAELRDLLSLGGRNPFFLLELTLEYLAGRMALGTEPGDHLPVPASIRQVLERRLNSLEGDARHVLEVMAIYGRDLPLDLLQTMSTLDREACLTGLDQLQRFRLILWTGDGATVRHGLIRHTVHARLTPARQVLIHERIARALVSFEGAGSPDELALHFDKAGVRDEALKYALEAADRAEAAGAVAEALRFLTIARRQSDDPERIAEINGRLGHLHYLRRNLLEAAPLLAAAADQFRTQGKLAASLVASVERLDALARMQEVTPTRFLEEIDRIKAKARRASLFEVVARALDVEVRALDRQAAVGEVRRVLREAAELADRGTPAARCMAKSTLALHLYYGSPRRALTASRDAVREAVELGSDPLLLKASGRHTFVLTHLGLLNSPEARATRAITADLAKKSGDLHQQFQLPLNLGVWHLDIGDYATAREQFERAERVAEGSPDAELEMLLSVNLGELALLEGDVETADVHFRRLIELQDSGIPTHSRQAGFAGQGLCALEKGRVSEALRLAELLPGEPAEWHFDRTLIVLFHSTLLKRTGRSADASELLRAVTRQIENRFVPGWLRLMIERVRIVRERDEAEAGTMAREALRVAERHSLAIRSDELRRLISNGPGRIRD